MGYPRIAPADAVVLITGGARGIGRATAESFRTVGAHVWIGDLDTEEAEKTAADLGVRALALDVTSRASFEAALAAVLAEHGRLDVLVNNAGVMPLGAFVDEPDALSRTTLDVNVMGPLLGMRVVLPHMIERGRGHVVNVASMAGKVPIPGMAVYNASKFAAVGLSAAVRAEVANSGVSVSAVLPSAVRTELAAGVPLGHGMPTVDPEDVAWTIVGTVHHRRAEVSVPRYLGPGWDVMDAVVPEFVQRVAFGLLDGNRALTKIDHSVRDAYDARVSRQSSRRGTESDS